MSQEQFVLSGVCDQVKVRLDGRIQHEFRQVLVEFSDKAGQVAVRLGNTHVSCSVLGEITAPASDRPNEGRLFFNLEMTPIASPAFESFRTSPEAVMIGNFVERTLRGSKAVDTDALCVLAGKSVWSLRVDMKVLNDDGNISDAVSLAALLALGTFRREISDLREPVPLAIHHLPISCTFALVNGLPLADPTSPEERVGNAFTLVANQHGELCGIHKPGGSPIDTEILAECFQVAVRRTKDISVLVQTEIANFNVRRKQLVQNIHQKYTADQLITVPSHSVGDILSA